MTRKEFIDAWLQCSLSKGFWTDSQLPESFRWFNAAGALLIGANNGDPNCLGGIRPGEAVRYRRVLEQWWDITDHSSAFQAMNSLMETGMRTKFVYSMQAYERVRGELSAMAGRNRAVWEKLYQSWKEQGPNAIAGWDLCRAVVITSWCHVCGYLSLEELMQIGISASRVLQKEFSSWDQAMESYLTGFLYWVDPQCREEQRRYQLRRHLYRTMRHRDGPFAAVDFSAPLSPVLTDADKAKMDIISN